METKEKLWDNRADSYIKEGEDNVKKEMFRAAASSFKVAAIWYTEADQTEKAMSAKQRQIEFLSKVDIKEAILDAKIAIEEYEKMGNEQGRRAIEEIKKFVK